MKKPLFFLFAVAWVHAANNSNWTSPLVHVTLPSAITSSQQGIRGLASPGDGYAYVGSGAGIYRALWSCIEANPTNASCWSALNTGVPHPTSGTTDLYLAGRDFDYIGGTVFAVFYNAFNGAQDHVCHWSGSAWVPETTTPAVWINPSSNGGPLYITHDPTTNYIYVGAWGIWVSTNQGATWSESPSGGTNAYAHLGYNYGVFYNTPRVRTYNGTPHLFWGGEGSLISQPMNFSSYKSWTPTGNGGCTYPNCFEHNMRGFETDGDPGTGGAIIVLINHCTAAGNQSTSCSATDSYITRSTNGGTTWVDPASVTFSGGNTQYWSMRNIAKGSAAHEFYIVGGQNEQYTGILGSLDGGATWALVGHPIATNGDYGSQFANIAINAQDDAKLLTLPGGVGVAPAMYFHPSPILLGTNHPFRWTGLAGMIALPVALALIFMRL